MNPSLTFRVVQEIDAGHIVIPTGVLTNRRSTWLERLVHYRLGASPKALFGIELLLHGLDERQAGDDAVLRGHGVDGEVGHVVSGCRSRGACGRPQGGCGSSMSNPGTSTGVSPREVRTNPVQR